MTRGTIGAGWVGATLALALGCGGAATSDAEHAEPPPTSDEVEVEASDSTDPPVAPGPHIGIGPAPGARDAAEGRDISMVGACCTSDAECSGLPCASYGYALESCPTVCKIPCQPGDRCPGLGGTSGRATVCADDGFCPVGDPGA